MFLEKQKIHTLSSHTSFSLFQRPCNMSMEVRLGAEGGAGLTWSGPSLLLNLYMCLCTSPIYKYFHLHINIKPSWFLPFHVHVIRVIPFQRDEGFAKLKLWAKSIKVKYFLKFFSICIFYNIYYIIFKKCLYIYKCFLIYIYFQRKNLNFSLCGKITCSRCPRHMHVCSPMAISKYISVNLLANAIPCELLSRFYPVQNTLTKVFIMFRYIS